MKNIHILPTDKPSRLVIDTIENKLYLQPILHEKTINVLPQHIYITSDEEIKEGDWAVTPNKTIMLVTTKYTTESSFMIGNSKHIGSPYYIEFCRKIILTTDPDLIKDGVQAIDDEFLEWFVKNPSCESVEVGYGFIRLTETDNEGYWVSIPNEQIEMQQEEPKQETLEEAAEWYAHNYFEMHETNNYKALKAGFEQGAKWQAQRMYTGEDIINALHRAELKYNKNFTKIYEGMKEYLNNLKTMENKTPTAEEFLKSEFCDHLSDSQKAVEFAKLHIEAQRKIIDDKIKHHFPQEFWEEILDKNFVLNCYPLDNIK